MANDESYKDPTNLENKIQKHQEFDAEVTANEQRIGSIAQVGVRHVMRHVYCMHHVMRVM